MPKAEQCGGHVYARRAGDRAALEHGAIHLTVMVIFFEMTGGLNR
jgi:hypothetical protein